MIAVTLALSKVLSDAVNNESPLIFFAISDYYRQLQVLTEDVVSTVAQTVAGSDKSVN